eukprot:Gb_21475 [translate_table: standard]
MRIETQAGVLRPTEAVGNFFQEREEDKENSILLFSNSPLLFPDRPHKRKPLQDITCHFSAIDDARHSSSVVEMRAFVELSAFSRCRKRKATDLSSGASIFSQNAHQRHQRPALRKSFR